jgi:hypothetical protein
VKENAKK